MTVTVNNVQVEFHLNPPKVTFLQGCNMQIAALQDAFRLIEESEEGRSQPTKAIISASGNENFSLDGSVKNALTMTILQPYVMQFEAGGIPFQTSVGNLLGTFLDSPGAIVQVNNAVGALSLNNAAIEYSSFNGGVTIDTTSSYSGTDYPTGTPQEPVNNLDDAHDISLARGFPIFYVLGDLDITAAVPVLNGHSFIGAGKDRTTINIAALANVLNCAYFDAKVTGTLDGDSRLNGCVIENLTYIKGFIEECVLSAGTIVLGGNSTAHFLDCWSGVPGTGTPIIDMGGSGQPLALRNYNGGVKLINKTGPEEASIDLNSGQVKIDLTTVTNGNIVVRGVGKVINAANDEWLPSGTYGSLTLLNETTYGKQIQEMWGLDGLDPDNPMTVTPTQRVAGDVDLTITGDGLTTTTVTRQ